MADSPPAQASKTFCILPWTHLAVMPEGSVKICCVAKDRIRANGAALSLQHQSLETIWNSAYLRAVRRDMLAGRHVPDCAACYLTEKHGGVSRRQFSNSGWADELGPLYDALVEESRHQDYVLSELPLSYQLMPGNLCNLKCRMCFPVFSSQIERDPIHSQWVAPLFDAPPEAPDWSGDRLTLAPQPGHGVRLTGFHGLETFAGRPFRWTDGAATAVIPLPHGIRPKSLRVCLGAGPTAQRLRILVNGTSVCEQEVSPGWEHTVELPAQPDLAELTVRMESGTIQPAGDPRQLGVALELLELVYTGAAEDQPVPGSRLPVGPWYRDDAWVREVLLQNADRLRSLYFTGGEPMIEKQVEHVLDHLIERQAADHVIVACNTNCTVLREPMLQKLSQFKVVHLGLSIDAQGAAYEYIRHPAKWAVVRRNVERLVALSGERLKLVGGVVLQVYNALHLVEVLEFFDGLNVPFSIEFATMPWFLSVGVLPGPVRELAARRLREYANRCVRPEQQTHVLSVARQIETMKDQCSPEALRTLMLFTNDLDTARHQNVREVHGELLQLLEDAGFRWTDERSGAAAA